MTGPEHYREAERLLAESQTITRPHEEGHCEADRSIAEAQVHATLALAAATALSATKTGAMPGLDFEDWRNTATRTGGN